MLFRSLDSETAAVMLAQLSGDEAASLRTAIRELGDIDPEEQADIAAEFRRRRPMAADNKVGVELSLSSSSTSGTGTYNVAKSTEIEHTAEGRGAHSGGRFEFLANASNGALVTFLAREHAQTISVVLSHLAAGRAAAVLAALPEKLQAETIERLSALGDADPESVTVLERELAAWLAMRGDDRGALARRRETVTNILAAADPKTRRGILHKLRLHNSALADQIEPAARVRDVGGIELSVQGASRRNNRKSATEFDSTHAVDATARIRRQLAMQAAPVGRPVANSAKTTTAAEATNTRPTLTPIPLPHIEFDQLIHLDMTSLNALLREVDPNVLAVALVGSQEEFVDRICGLMPKRISRAFRRELRKLGPTRLSDVELAQRTVADTAARQMVRRRQMLVAAR